MNILNIKNEFFITLSSILSLSVAIETSIGKDFVYHAFGHEFESRLIIIIMSSLIKQPGVLSYT